MIKSYPINEKVSAKEILRVKEKFIKTGILEKGVVRPIISESWKRCRQMGIDPEELNTSTVLPKNESNRMKIENANLINIAKPFLDNLYKILEKSYHVVVLFDKNGYCLYTAANKSHLGYFWEQMKMFRKICDMEAVLILSYSPYNSHKKAHPRLLTIEKLKSIAKKYFTKVSIESFGNFSHSKLNRTDKNFDIRYDAELLIICEQK